MSRHRSQLINALAVATLSLALTSACGPKKNEGEGLQVAVQPSNEVLMGPGPMSSCLDAEVLKTNGTFSRTIQGPVMVFNRFQLLWTSSDTLFVQEIKWSVTGPGIQNGVFESAIGLDEIEALVGRLNGIVAGPMTDPINSDDSARNSVGGGKFAPCGLVLGNIPLANPKGQIPFKARVKIEVIGTAIQSNGDQRFVRQTITTQARFEGI